MLSRRAPSLPNLQVDVTSSVPTARDFRWLRADQVMGRIDNGSVLPRLVCQPRRKIGGRSGKPAAGNPELTSLHKAVIKTIALENRHHDARERWEHTVLQDLLSEAVEETPTLPPPKQIEWDQGSAHKAKGALTGRVKSRLAKTSRQQLEEPRRVSSNAARMPAKRKSSPKGKQPTHATAFEWLEFPENDILGLRPSGGSEPRSSAAARLRTPSASTRRTVRTVRDAAGRPQPQ